MKKVNYHSHTYYCGHAVGDERDVVEAALSKGFDVIGLSEHIPLPNYRWHLIKAFPKALPSKNATKECINTIIKNGPNMRMVYSKRKEHFKKVKELKEEYRNRIEVYQGFEAEYLEEYLDYYQSLLDSKEVDYLILGHHFDSYCIHNYYNGRNDIDDKGVEKYKEDVIKAFETNLFSYIAHPDLFMIGKVHWDDQCERVTREICESASKNKVLIEVNAGGIRRGLRPVNDQLCYPFPNKRFYQIAKEVGCQFILGADTHRKEDYEDGSYEYIENFAQELDLPLVDVLPFKKGKKR